MASKPACLLPVPAEVAGSGFFLPVPANHQDCELFNSCLNSSNLSAQLPLGLMSFSSLPHTSANGSPDDAPQFLRVEIVSVKEAAQFLQITTGLALFIPQFINACFESGAMSCSPAKSLSRSATAAKRALSSSSARCASACSCEVAQAGLSGYFPCCCSSPAKLRLRIGYFFQSL
jgi:hypothetical protein